MLYGTAWLKMQATLLEADAWVNMLRDCYRADRTMSVATTDLLLTGSLEHMAFGDSGR